MKSINRFRIPMIVLCLLVLSTLFMVGCGDGDDETTSTTVTTEEGATDTSEVSNAVAPAGSVVVPQLVEKSEANAKAILADLGLGSKSSPHYLADPTSTGWVATQSVAAGAVVPVGTIVNIGIAAQGTVVPHLAGLAKSDAEAELAAVGLQSAVVYQATTDSSYWGKVMKNEPAYLTVVAPGSTVTLTVGKKAFQMPSTSSTTLIPVTIPTTPITAAP